MQEGELGPRSEGESTGYVVVEVASDCGCSKSKYTSQSLFADWLCMYHYCSLDLLVLLKFFEIMY